MIHTSCFTYSPENILVGDTLLFNNCSENANKFQWDFGDGSQSGVRNPQHFYTNSGEYEVQLYSLDNNEITSLSTQTIVVNKLKLESLEIKPKEQGDEIYFYFKTGKHGAYYDPTYFDLLKDTSLIYKPKNTIVLNNSVLDFYYYGVVSFNTLYRIDDWKSSLLKYSIIYREKLHHTFVSDSLGYSVKFNFSLAQL